MNNLYHNRLEMNDDALHRLAEFFCGNRGIKNRGITPIITTLLLLMIVVVLISMAYIFFTKTFESVSGTTGNQAGESLRQIGEDFKIDSVDVNRIYIRNTGTSELKNLKFYVNNAIVSASGPASVAAGDVGCFVLESSKLTGTVNIKTIGSVKTKETQQDYTGVGGHKMEFRVYWWQTSYVNLSKITVNTGPSWNGADPALGHQLGRQEGTGWSAEVSLDTNQGFLSYGPYYQGLSSGANTATWGLMVDVPVAPNVRIATVQVYDSTADSLLAINDLFRSNFTQAYVFQDFGLNFTYPSTVKPFYTTC